MAVMLMLTASRTRSASVAGLLALPHASSQQAVVALDALSQVEIHHRAHISQVLGDPRNRERLPTIRIVSDASKCLEPRRLPWPAPCSLRSPRTLRRVWSYMVVRLGAAYHSLAS